MKQKTFRRAVELKALGMWSSVVIEKIKIDECFPSNATRKKNPPIVVYMQDMNVCKLNGKMALSVCIAYAHVCRPYR